MSCFLDLHVNRIKKATVNEVQRRCSPGYECDMMSAAEYHGHAAQRWLGVYFCEATRRKWKINTDHVNSVKHYTLIRSRFSICSSRNSRAMWLKCWRTRRVVCLFCFLKCFEPQATPYKHPPFKSRILRLIRSIKKELYIELANYTVHEYPIFPLHREKDLWKSYCMKL